MLLTDDEEKQLYQKCVERASAKCVERASASAHNPYSWGEIEAKVIDILALRHSTRGGRRKKVPLNAAGLKALEKGCVDDRWRSYFMGRQQIKDFSATAFSARRSQNSNGKVAAEHLRDLETELRCSSQGGVAYTPIMDENGFISDGRRVINIDEGGQAHAFGGQKGNNIPRKVGGDHQRRVFEAEFEHRQQDTLDLDVAYDLDGFKYYYSGFITSMYSNLVILILNITAQALILFISSNCLG